MMSGYDIILITGASRISMLMGVLDLNIFFSVAVCLNLLCAMPVSHGYTDQQDVYAINSLYVALGFPPLPGWTLFGGDPCGDGWQGVQCVNSNITAIILTGADFGGELGDRLVNFSSLIIMDLSNNHIGGTIPESLPLTIRQFFLSGNRLTGSIPGSISELTLLTDMSLNDNLLTGELPDAFQALTGLVNLDLSANNLSGQLPPSMESLSSLASLHVQNNQLSGTLNVLQNLPLQDLNVENNLFSGPIPAKLLNIPNFKSDGNPFNTTVAPAPVLPPVPWPPVEAPAPEAIPASSHEGPIHGSNSAGENHKVSVKKLVGYAAGGVALLIVAIIIFMFCITKWQGRRLKDEKTQKELEIKTKESTMMPRFRSNFSKPHKEVDKFPKETSQRPTEHIIEVAGTRKLPPVEKVTLDLMNTAKKNSRSPSKNLNKPTSMMCFSVAVLQQYTNSFSEENLIQDGRLGPVYLAEFPQGKLLAVLKLNNLNTNIPDHKFLELVSSISKIQHHNIVELVGYCAEFEQRLLVYNYFSAMTLYDVLHFEDQLKKRLSWNARIQVALEAAKALEYLHEGCQTPNVHQNFESNSILINDDLTVRISGCGFASIYSSNHFTQLSSSTHAPEVNDCGAHSVRSDVFDFGVVMLELLTGRKPHDRSLPRVEQYLVRWASSQLHDIDTLTRMVDPSIDGKYPMKSLSRFADIISRCIQQVPEFRPPMSEVVQDLACIIKDATKSACGDSYMI